MKRHRRVSVAALGFGFAALAEPLSAGKIDVGIDLMFIPQQEVAGVSVSITPEMLEQPVVLQIVDRRRGADPSLIGTRTDSDDRPHALQASGDVASFVTQTIESLAHDWGLAVAPDAGRLLEITLLSFQVLETNQALGATFKAESRLALALLDAAGNRLWSGSASGEATRYGRAQSDANCNEVLSDSLLEAFANALNQPGLQEAWAGKATVGASDGADSAGGSLDVVTPEELLDEVAALLAQGFHSETLIDFIERRALSQPLSAGDLARWKERGVPENVIRVALARPVR